MVNGETAARSSKGAAVAAGAWELHSGLVELEVASGTSLLVEAPASFELLDTRHVRLLAGSLVVRMPKGESGFVVEMPQMRVTDLGTEFGTSVASDGKSRVQVFDGKVRAESRGGKGPQGTDGRRGPGEHPGRRADVAGTFARTASSATSRRANPASGTSRSTTRATWTRSTWRPRRRRCESTAICRTGIARARFARPARPLTTTRISSKR